MNTTSSHTIAKPTGVYPRDPSLPPTSQDEITMREDLLFSFECTTQGDEWGTRYARRTMVWSTCIPIENVFAMSRTTVRRLFNALVIPRTTSFQEHQLNHPLAQLVTELVTQQPKLARQPAKLFTYIEAFKQLVP